jgi:hypothetical protein
MVFARVDPDLQFFLGLVVAGMLCGGAFVLSSVPWAATCYVLILCGGA